MFDFDKLDQKEVWERANGLLVKKCAGTKEAKDAAAVLKIAVESAAKDKEPPEFILNRWSRSQANDLIRHFVIEEEIGVGESIKLREVQRLLGAVDWSPAGLTAFFGAEERDVMEVLKVFAGVDMLDGESMRFRGVYRLLEVLGCSLRAFLNRLVDEHVDEVEGSGTTLRFGSYRVLKGIGSGFNGMCIYAGEHVVTHQRVAVKWPVGKVELEVLRDIQRQSSPDFPGLPQVFAHGSYDGTPYVVTELLGSPLTKIFERMNGRPPEQRWRVVRVVGRMVLRRLEEVHRCGYVHCDVSPENILFGPPRTTDKGQAAQAVEGIISPYLIDFGLAQRHPGGLRLEREHGSSEWSSVRSALGGVRRPEDDLEALGWILVHGVFGGLPWLELLSKAYESWDSPAPRARAIRKVQEAKLHLLNDGFSSLGDHWSVLAQIPQSLERYLQICRSDTAGGSQLDYARLAELLGARDDLSLREAELFDLQHFKDVTALYF